ncbi:MAG: CdvA-like protein [Thermoproteota archaeon]|nr:CdvA-like protein [Thermoproteota archaeon]MDQ5842100.1 CdvA-like protein [Thermoproteota archaeon]
MSEEKLGFVGKQVKDIYGTYIGRAVGIITENDGEIEAVGVDCGSGGLKQLPYEQLVIQGEYVFFIPRWRLDAQRLLRQKSLTLKRIKALQDILSENDSMKEDAELVYMKYEKKLHELDETGKQVNDKLNARLAELDLEAKNIKAVLFDAKLQFRSNEMKEETYQQVKVQTDELIEHINNERAEINNVKEKLTTQTLENIITTSSGSSSSTVAVPSTKEEEGERPTEQTPSQPAEVVSVVQVTATSSDEKEEKENNDTHVSSNDGEHPETNWLNQVITK